jgi:hypothetical protein
VSWEAVAWANNQKLKKSHEQIVLLVLANNADKDGEAFTKWPYKDHWWHYLSEKTRLPRSSLFRHLNTIIALGLGSKSMIVLADGTKRPTIRLDMQANFDIDREADAQRYEVAVNGEMADDHESHPETDERNPPTADENSRDFKDSHGPDAPREDESRSETEAAIPTRGNDPFPIVGMQKDSNKNPNLSPNPLSEGAHDGFDDFVKTWGEPIPRYELAKAEWGRLPTDKHGECLAAAAGLWAWAAKNPKKPTPSAQSFLRDRSGWMQWLRYTPDAGSIAPQLAQGYARDSVEGIALVKLHDAVGVGEGFRQIYAKHGTVNYRKAMTPQIAAFAQMPARDNWVQVNHQQAGSWSALGRELSMMPRPKQFQSGDAAPWPWPPGKDGKLYTTSTGPPATEGLMTEEDEHHI